MAVDVLRLIEHAWHVQTETLGFRPPLPDAGLCGPDAAYDIFLWRGSEESYVQAIGPNLATAHDDWFTFMVLDPWGPYGGDLLPSTIAHELNHAMQATDDWWESAAASEMTATFAEEIVHPDHDQWIFVLEDFQRHPERSIFHVDDYRSWSMYGAALFLHLIRERHTEGNPSFLGKTWLRSRYALTFEEALDTVLQEHAGTTLPGVVTELAAWRWYVDDRDDGAHFADAALFPPPAVAATVTETPATITVAPMPLGTVYIQVPGVGEHTFTLKPHAPVSARWHVQVLPGSNSAPIGVIGPRGGALRFVAPTTLAVTALPLRGLDALSGSSSSPAATVVIERGLSAGNNAARFGACSGIRRLFALSSSPSSSRCCPPARATTPRAPGPSVPWTRNQTPVHNLSPTTPGSNAPDH